MIAQPSLRSLLPAVALALCLLVLAQLLGFDAVRVGADGIVVNTTVDAVDADPGDGVCATVDGLCSLRAAVQETNAFPGPDTIILPPGTYVLSVEGSGEDEAATGDLDVSDKLSLQGTPGATAIDGGALDRVLELDANATLNISGLTIRNGAADLGAGIKNAGSLALVQSAVEDNRGAVGAGIYNLGTLRISDSLLTGNVADGDGGAILSWSSTTLELVNVTISGNTAGHGAGVFHYGASAEIDNVTIVYNVATDAPGGGYKHFGGLASIKNSIIAHNTPQDCFFGMDSAGNNIESGTSCDFLEETDLQDTDPLVGPLESNGGPTRTHALLAGSPAIDAGGDPCPPPATDQRGAPRPQGTACDLGAFELGDAPLTAPPGPATGAGDVDCDGSVTSRDAALILQHVAQLTGPPICYGGADVNGDGEITPIDATVVLQFVAGLLDALPAGAT